MFLLPACNSVRHTAVPIEVAEMECRMTQVATALSTVNYNLCLIQGELYATPVVAGTSKAGMVVKVLSAAAVGMPIGIGASSIKAGTEIAIPGR